MNVLGWVTPGQTIYLPWNTFNSSGASVTLSGLAVGDIKIYKNGSTTERSSTSGYTLLDTDGIDFDGLTGIHGISINLADNTDAGFYTAGAHYAVAVSTVTVDGQTVSFIAGTFRIGYANARLNTTIATLYAQNIFDLTAGPAHANALSGMEIIIHSADSPTKFTSVVVNAYSSSKNIVLAAAPSLAFTIAAGDNVSVMGPAALRPIAHGRQIAIDASNQVSVGTMAPDSINAAALASDAGTELATAVRTNLATELARIDVASSTLATASALTTVGDNVAAVLADTGTDGVVVADASKSGYALSSAGLDSIATTAPTGVASNFREMVVQSWRRWFKKAVHDTAAETLKTYADDGTTVVTTQTLSESGDTETQGAAS